MKIFQLFRKNLAIVGIEPIQPFKKNHSMIMLLRRLWVVILTITWLVFSVVFLVYEAKTLDKYADAFYMAATLISTLNQIGIFIWKMASFFKLVEDFENHIEQRMKKNPESISIYLKLDENIEKWTGLLRFAFVNVTITAITAPKLILSFYLYFITDLGPEAFTLPFPVWTPWNWRTPIGYLIIFTIQYSTICYAAYVGACSIGMLIASCHIVFNFCNEIKNETHAFNESIKSGGKLTDLMEKVADNVTFHSGAKQLVFDINNCFTLFIITFSVWSLTNICSTLLMIQMELEQNANLIELIKPIFLVFWSLCLIFLICNFGQKLTDSFDELNDALYDCDCTLLPRDIQKMLPIIIQNTQRPIVLRVFEKFACNRESFKKVANNGFSYFMIFRKFK